MVVLSDIKLAPLYVIIILIASLFLTGITGIINGRRVRGHKPYMVYLLTSPAEEKRRYSAWTCGGAIITPMYILTSGTCLNDVRLTYVVSGYAKYVNADEIKQHKCIDHMKKRIVYVCLPQRSAWDKERLFHGAENWIEADIAVAQVHSAFDFNDLRYKQFCSYQPAPIRVNIENRYAEAHTPVLTFGWGHRQYYRTQDIDIDMNEKYLRYSSAKLLDLETCYYTFYSKHLRHHLGNFKRYLLCAGEIFEMDENGHIKDSPSEWRRMINSTITVLKGGKSSEEEYLDNQYHVGGFCQNDHGGPLISYIGGRETVIGVASSFFLDTDMKCVGPYLYTSTRCVSRLIQCVVEPLRYRREFDCDGDHEMQRMREWNITWPDHLVNETDGEF